MADSHTETAINLSTSPTLIERLNNIMNNNDSYRTDASPVARMALSRAQARRSERTRRSF